MYDDLETRLGIGNSAEQILNVAWANNSNYTVRVKRDDLLHSIISGNKWRKVKYALVDIINQSDFAKPIHIVSFGGGFSNHIHALAYCCYLLNQHPRAIKFTAIIRGDYSNNMTPMLQDIAGWGAEIRYVDRVTYRRRTEPKFLDELRREIQTKTYPKVNIIPEGGSQDSALPGFKELLGELENPYDFILCPVASGATMAGLVLAVDDKKLKTKIVGIAALKGEDYLEGLVEQFLPKSLHGQQTQGVTKNAIPWVIEHGFHFGGYAKKDQNLVNFCDTFTKETAIQIEPVYSGKLFFALKHLLIHNYFPKKSRILVIHTGGLQGARSDQHN